MIRVALLGNPNVGKSSLFNSLTGKKQKVANWPGKTIECKQGTCKVGNSEIEVFDLPGAYSLSPFSDDEKVVEETLKTVYFDVLLHIIDSSNLERNLYLTLELLEKTNRLVVALNMTDIAAKEGLDIDEKKLSRIFKVDFVKIDARNSESLGFLLTRVVEAAKKPKKHKKTISSRISLVKHRYQIIQKATDSCIKQRKKVKYLGNLDYLVLHRVLGPVLFLMLMFFVFHLTFFLSAPLTDLFNSVWSLLTLFILNSIEELILIPQWMRSLLENGVIAGVGSIISFFPPIAIMMFLLYFLEDSGYLARAVIVLDDFLKKFGLGGKSFIPLLLGVGCNVPAILTTRIIKDRKTKLITLLSIPFMSCSARLPIYVLFAGVFFSGNEANVIFFMYLLGFIVAILNAFILKKFVFMKKEDELLIELPKYHWPHLKNLYIETKRSVLDFTHRAGTVILIASVIIWFLASVPYGVEYGSKDSFAGMIGTVISPVFSPLGFNSWQSGLALLNGMVAKEIVVSTFATTYGLIDEAQLPSAIENSFTPASALAFMVFALLYVPCFATVGTIKGETGSWRITLVAVTYYIIVAYCFSFLVYSLASVVM